MRATVWAARLPWSMVGLASLLVMLGWLGIARSEELAGTSGRYLTRQMVWSGLALVGMLLVAVPSYRVLSRWSFAVYGVAIVLLVVVYGFPPINGAHRWIRLGPIGLQPSEFAKLAFVLALARYLMAGESYRHLGGLLAPLTLTFVPMLLILREPDLGTALVFPPVLFVMLYAAGARTRDLATVALCGIALVPLLWTQMSREQKSRVTALFQQTAPDERPSADGYHLHQAKQLMALGGVGGTFLHDASPDETAASHLPAAHTDFVFSVLGERYGWLGTGGLLLLYTLLLWRGLAIAHEAQEPYGRLLAVGLAALLGVQLLINTSMAVGLLPVTGLALPLVSYGGSGLLAHALALGLLLNVGLRPGYEVAPRPFRFAHD